jgi:gas vesicle protein
MGYGSIDDVFKGGLTGAALIAAVKLFYADKKKEKLKNTENDGAGDEETTNLGLDIQTAKNFGNALTNPLAEMSTAVTGIVQALDPTNFDGADYLMKSGQELANAMGIGQARMSEMRTTIADAIPEMIKLGLSSSEAFKVIEGVPVALGVNTTMGTEALREMGAAAQVSGVESKKLALEFKGVGMSLYDVGDRMAEVAVYAKSVGVNVKAVSAEVVTNLKQLNLFNFDSGVKGLAKMASQASMLGFSMEKTFKLAEDLMSPEKAIDLAASLQRLGVSSSALLDPLKAMDLAQNDPEALQKEIINISKEFTKLKADGSGFEILPGAKRRLREVASAMGMSADELANMSIKSADLDMKMSKIKFPSLAASEEDKMLIANMSQMKNGEAVVQIKNEKTGAMEEVNVSKLTADQLTKLREQQADKDKTIEELALDQLNVLQSINAGINGGKAASLFGKASTPAMDRLYNAVNVVRTESVRAVSNRVTTNNVRERYSAVSGGVEEMGVKALQGDFSGAGDALLKLGPSLIQIGRDVATGFGKGVSEGYGNIKQGVQAVYEPVTGVKPFADDEKSTQLYKDFEKIMGSEFVDKITGGIVSAFNLVTTKQEVSGNIELTIKGDGGGSITNTEFGKRLIERMKDPTFKSEYDKINVTNNSGLMADKK